jgi:hypothetical protein
VLWKAIELQQGFESKGLGQDPSNREKKNLREKWNIGIANGHEKRKPTNQD